MGTTLIDKTFAVTGATSGIGREIVAQLAEENATIIAIGRSGARCQAAEKDLRAQYPGAAIHYLTADLSLQSEVRQAGVQVRTVLEKLGKSWLDGLVNNAGTFTYWFALTPEGFETQWAVNHLAPFLLTQELLPSLQAAPAARVVTVSSASHYGAHLDFNDIQLRRHYNGLRAYEQSKLANVLFSSELNRRLGPRATVHAYAADPGLVKTDIGLKGTPAIVRWFWSLRRSGGISAGESARGIVHLLASSAVEQSQDRVYWKHGQPKSPSRYSQDPEIARRLWDISETMCGLS
jgi:NAD(P)-dependent dehydrogenase (short-subunit alcohol dehydrogenase family)